MHAPNLLTSLAAVFAVLAAVTALLGVAYSPVALGVAVPFGVAATVLWYQASGRLARRLGRRAARDRAGPTGRRAGRRADGRRADSRADGSRAAGRADGRRAGGRVGPAADSGPTPREARRVLGVDGGAGQAEIRRAYREKAKELHPDRGGDESEFRRVTRAYERLREGAADAPNGDRGRGR